MPVPTRSSTKKKELCLSIAEDAPEVFRNQQYGKAHTMTIRVCLSDGSVPVLLSPFPHVRLALGAELLYADTLLPVPQSAGKKHVLMVSQQVDIGANGQGSIAARINDVSRNHANRKFRIKITCVGGLCMINPVLTRPILCISKSTRKRPPSPPVRSISEDEAEERHTKSDDDTLSSSSSSSEEEGRLTVVAQRPAKRRCSSLSTAAAWNDEAASCLALLEWRAIGTNPAHAGRTIWQCGVCGVLSEVSKSARRCHRRGCRLDALLRTSPPPPSIASSASAAPTPQSVSHAAPASPPAPLSFDDALSLNFNDFFPPLDNNDGDADADDDALSLQSSNVVRDDDVSELLECFATGEWADGVSCGGMGDDESRWSELRLE